MYLIRDATSDREGGPLDQAAITRAWDGGIHVPSYTGMCLSGHRKPRQSLLDTLYALTRDAQLVADVKEAAIRAFLAKHPKVNRGRAFVDDVGGR